MPDGVPAGDIRGIFEQHGEVKSLDLKVNGWGFVTFKDYSCAPKAVDALKNLEINGKKIFVTKAKSDAKRKKKAKQAGGGAVQSKGRGNRRTKDLHVRNLPSDMDEGRLREIFQLSGDNINVDIALDEEGRSRCYGFIRYSTPGEATQAAKKFRSELPDYLVRFATSRGGWQRKSGGRKKGGPKDAPTAEEGEN